MDILEDLLQAYLSDLATEAGAGGDITWLKSWYSVRNPSVIPPTFQTRLPMILVYPSGDVPVEPDCLPGKRDLKTYTITLSLFVETLGRDNAAFLWHNGSSYTNEVTTKIKTLESLYRRETFGLTAVCKTTSMSYITLAMPTYQGREIDQGHITFEHLHQDGFA